MQNNLNYINILNWNANGIKRQSNIFEIFMHEHNIHLACITETHLIVNEKLYFSGYKIYRNDRPSDIASGGVAIIVSNKIKHNQIISPNSPELETIAVKIQLNSEYFNIHVAYRPPKYKFPLISYKQILINSSINNNNNTKILLFGDLNSKNRIWGCNTTSPQGIKLHSFIQTNNLKMISPNEPTYYSYNDNIIPDILDICIATKNINIPISQNVIADLDSDHCPIIITLHIIINNINSTHSPIINKINWFKFQQIIEETIVFPTHIDNTTILDDKLTEFTTTIKNSLQQSVIPINHTYTYPHTPIPYKILNLIKSKRNLRRIWQNTRRRDIKTKINKLAKIIKSKLEYRRLMNYQHFINQIHPNSRNLWSTIKRLCKEKPKIPILKNLPVNATTDKEKADLLAKSFQKFFTPNPPTNIEFNTYISSEMNLLLQHVPQRTKFISPSEIKSIIKHLKTRKSPGLDNITNKAIKMFGNKTTAALTSIYNSALRLGYFPNEWKIAIILAFNKPHKDPRLPSNYRPISLLSSLSKIFEKLILTRLNKFLSANCVIPTTQFGFKPNHATTHQLLRITEHIANAFHHKQHTLSIFLDIEKAFDKVWHLGLLYKLRKIGLPIYLYNIIQSFLNNRYFMVKINTTFSEKFPTNAGVPQGSCLSPVLFNIYLSDIPSLPSSEIALYADDTSLFTSHSDILCAYDNLQQDLDIYVHWAEKWRIKLNLNKCQAKIFTLRKPYFPPSLKILNTPITWLSKHETIKYLGIELDTTLTWNKHIKNTINKTKIKILKIKSLLSSKFPMHYKCSILLYKSIIRPTLIYGSPIWSNAAETHLQKIQIIQNKFIRKALQAPWFIPNTQLHKEFSLDYIKDHIQLNNQKFFTLLHNFPHKTTFNLGQTYNFPRRIKSRFPKDKFRPP